jgi:hypothetical protein
MFSKYVDIEGTAIHYFHTGPSTLPGVAPALDRGELLLFLHDRAVPRHGRNAGVAPQRRNAS